MEWKPLPTSRTMTKCVYCTSVYFSVVSFRCVEIAKVLTLKFSGFDFETEHCGEYTLDDVSFYESHFDKQSFWFLFFSAMS